MDKGLQDLEKLSCVQPLHLPNQSYPIPDAVHDSFSTLLTKCYTNRWRAQLIKILILDEVQYCAMGAYNGLAVLRGLVVPLRCCILLATDLVGSVDLVVSAPIRSRRYVLISYTIH